ncbi:UDP-glycosyltransferase UGT5-like [Episyrphus balteatus]|uniref:UDP-glycosyltransferase UGT5-like n=1 Tax=Episyrphus balteatus TaxID=286459 RepID=UPI002486818F|nr:UDP-glycosyltransferase UGT5-like [Episyrphus balteatus]
MFLKTIPVLAVFLLLQVSCGNSDRILAFFPAPVKSHLIIHTAITQALAELGHNITVVTTIPLTTKNPKYRHIQLDGCSIPKNFFNEKVNEGQPFYKQFVSITQVINNCSNVTLQHPKMRQLMAEEQFDLVIMGYFFNELQVGLAAHFKCPIVISFMVQPIRLINEFVGNPMEVSYVPNLLSGADQPMSFLDRLKNFMIVEVLEPVMLYWFANGPQKSLYEYNFPSDKYPSFDEVKKNVSLVLVNHHFSQGPIRPNVPGLIEIGGIQVKDKPDPLPEDIKSIMDNAKNGIIYFSFGSNIQGDILNKEKAKIMFDVLSKLPYTILWKWGKTDYPGQGPNVIYKTWLPQDDVLAHPNVKLFVTHGGQGSIVESLYHGVPMVGVPLFGEQHVNMVNVQKKEYGRHVEFVTMTEETFGNAVNDVLTNTKYRKSVQKFAKLYKDRPMTAKESVVFWVEYVLRHQGAAHLQSPAVHMNSFQLMSLDVIGFLALVGYLVFKLLKLFVCFIYSMCRRRNNMKNKKE